MTESSVPGAVGEPRTEAGRGAVALMPGGLTAEGMRRLVVAIEQEALEQGFGAMMQTEKMLAGTAVGERPLDVRPHLSLQERIDALARALYVAGIRSDHDKDGLPRIIAEGIYANLRNVQRLDLYRPETVDEALARLSVNEGGE